MPLRLRGVNDGRQLQSFVLLATPVAARCVARYLRQWPTAWGSGQFHLGATGNTLPITDDLSTAAAAAAPDAAGPGNADHQVWSFAHDRVALPGRLLGIRAQRTWCSIDSHGVTARFGPWCVTSPLENISGVEVTGPYQWIKVVGPPHLSASDGGLTFATNASRGVCLTFRRAVPGSEPLGLLRHGSLTMTLDDPDGFRRAVEERIGNSTAGPSNVSVVEPVDRSRPVMAEMAQRLEQARSLDQIAAIVARAGTRTVGSGRSAAIFSGAWLGHALHPMLTDFPLGSWMSASLLDLAGGSGTRAATRRLIGFGTAAAIPTALSGWKDWLSATTEEKRVGVAHATINSAALLLYATSYVSRRRGHHRRGVLFGLLGGFAATLGGYFGGHLSTARDTGLRATQMACAHAASNSY